MDPKTLRKQIRNVLQETSKEILASETGESVKKELLDYMNSRLDQIDKYCQSALQREMEKGRSIYGFVIGEVKGNIQRDLYNATITVDAIVSVLADAGLNIPDFSSKVDAKKVEIDEQRKKQSDENMQKEMERRVQEAKEQDQKAAEDSSNQQPSV